MYSFLDGLVHLAFSDYTPLQGEEVELNLTRKRGNIDVNSMVRKQTILRRHMSFILTRSSC